MEQLLPDIGHMIGKGNTAEVYYFDEHRAVKLYTEKFGIDLALYEQGVLRAVNNSGTHSPAAGDIVKYGNRIGLRMELIGGSTLDKLLMAAPARLEEYSHVMASLHAHMHSTTTDKLQTQGKALRDRIKNNSALLGDFTGPILDYLETLGGGAVVCHGDFHPKNVLLGPVKSAVIDWTNAYRGQPASDVTMTRLRLLSPYVPKNFTGDSHTFTAAKNAIYEIYINEYYRLTGIAEDDLDPWLLPCAAAQMHPLKTAHSEWLLEIITQQMESKGL